MVLNRHMGNQYKIAVLLASHNGSRYLEEQVASIRLQVGVEVDIFFSDDQSSDCTVELLTSLSCKNLNRYNVAFGSAAKNFFFLITELEVSNYSYVFLSDQDDIWLTNKCVSAIKALENNSADFYCGSYTSFSGTKLRYVDKKGNFFPYSWIFQSAGPGFTFCFSKNCFIQVSHEISQVKEIWNQIRWHDWYIFNLIFSLKFRSYVDNMPHALYRIHSDNDTGQLNSVSQFLWRFKYVFFGQYRQQILMLPYLGKKNHLRRPLSKFDFINRIKLCSFIMRTFGFKSRGMFLIFWALFSRVKKTKN